MKHFSTLLLFFFPAVLIALTVFLSLQNYTPGTFLSGWDTLHPEFDLKTAFARVLNGVWRADQGLGAVAGHSHMAELPRIIFLWIESLLFPLAFLRYSYFFLMLIAGILGMFFLTKKIIGRKNGSSIAFLSGLTYLANLGTVQIFIVPFEMFAVQYAALPWILITATRFLSQGKLKDLFFFFLIIIAASPMAYAATLWYAFFICFTLFILIFAGKNQVKRALLLIGTTILLNLYWILPNVYFTVTHARQVQQSKVNQLFSPEAFAKNQEFGTITNVPILKSFLFDWQLVNPKTHQFEEVMARWESHLAHPAIQAFGYLVFVLALFGIIQSFRRRNRIGIAMLPLFVIPFFFLLNGTFPINRLFDAIGTVSPILKEALRFPFTKFSILFMVAISFYVGQGLAFIFNRFKSLSKGIVISYTIASLIYFLPAFQGNLIHPAMRVTIPNEYFAMFDWFRKQNPDGRVALLPIYTFWGWTYYSWGLPASGYAGRQLQAGYQGAGFLQFGIPQPIMDRDYNRWSTYNELYQREMSYAIYSQNPTIIADLLAKYHIQWILLDRSVISPGNEDSSLLLWRIPALLEQTGQVTLVKIFGNDLSIYKVTENNSIQSTTILPDVAPDERFTGQVEEPPIATFSGRQYKSINTPTSDHMSISDLSHDQAYVVTIKSRNVQGFPLQLCISNDLTGHCDLFTHLSKDGQLHTEKFLLPPISDYGTGYTLNFNNFAISGQTSINDVASVTISRAQLPESSAQPVNPSTVVLDQAFDPGWIAWDGKQILPHVLVNNWANGWLMKSDHPPAGGPTNKIWIFFLPQLLEFIGFALLPLPFLTIILYDKRVWRK